MSEEIIEKENEELTELSEKELDNVADTAIEALRDILSFFNVDGAEINEYEGDEQEIILDVVGGDDLAALIGRHGKTLEALQLIISTITFKKLGFHYPIIIDIESYVHRQRQKIESIAETAADRACRQDKPVKLRPMTPYERRLVHIMLRDDTRVETSSEGKDPHRYVVVHPV